jgi:cardiolipin synthase
VPTDVSTDQTPLLVGAKGQLSPERSKAILDAVHSRSSGTDLLDKHLAMEEAITDLPLTIGNRVTLLQDGPATYRAMHAAIRSARDHINLETYILEDDEIGRQLSDLLIDKQKAGVQVNTIYDSVGSISRRRPFQRLADHGDQRGAVQSSQPTDAKEDWHVNRDHRKLLITDGRFVFSGWHQLRGCIRGLFRPPPANRMGATRGATLMSRSKVLRSRSSRNYFCRHGLQKGPPLVREYFPN